MIIKKILIGLLLWVCTQLAHAHAMGSSFLHLTEQSPGKFTMRWIPAKELKYLSMSITPQLPAHCQLQDTIFDCGSKGLVGTIEFANLPMHSDTVVRVEWLNGNQNTKVLSINSPSIELTEANYGTSSGIQVFTTYLVIGVEHILLGVDHLLFVVGLVFLVGFKRRLVWTVTAFTFAHSLTLALSVVGIITVPQATVEIIIALSIVLVAGEIIYNRNTLARRQPWLVALIFGLVHGLGFAGALREVGLPEHELPLSLLAFNLGVELGQLGVILILYLVSTYTVRVILPNYEFQRMGTIVVYTMGSLGAFWVIDRSVSLVGIG